MGGEGDIILHSRGWDLLEEETVLGVSQVWAGQGPTAKRVSIALA